MSLQQIGKGHVVGVEGADDFFGAVVSYQGAEETDDFQKKYTKNNRGDTVGGFGYDGRRQLTIDMITQATTIAAAEGALKKPSKMAKVVLSSFKDATINGNWIYEGGCKIRYVNDDVAKITLPLVRFDADISTPVNA
jgi:hypothetical protein